MPYSCITIVTLNTLKIISKLFKIKKKQLVDMLYFRTTYPIKSLAIMVTACSFCTG